MDTQENQQSKTTGINIKKLLLNKWFLGILAVKVILSFLFAADVMTQGFTPFINYFVSSRFHNPYNYFFEAGLIKAFPYPSVMLWILSVPRALLFFLIQPDIVGFVDIFITRIPVLLADIVIYLVLCRWLETKENKVLLLYWASPILIYINYFHGQLDVIPTAILFLSLLFLFQRKHLKAFITLGIGFAIKSHLIAALPLYLVYLIVNKERWYKIGYYTLISVLTFGVLVLPYIFSTGYEQMVLMASEQKRLFLLDFPYYFDNIKILLAPGAYLLLVFRFASYKKINHDMFILILGLIFSVLVILVPPMPGWFYWSIPFLAYFYIKRTEAPVLNFWLLNIFYILYFVFQPEGSFMESFQLVAPALALQPAPIELIANIGRNSTLFSNILFTALEASMIMNVLWCYKAGIKSNSEYRIKEKPLLIGIGGDSGAGKSTCAISLEKLFGKRNTVCVNGDDVHKWPRGHENWSIFTHLNPQSNHLHTELEHAIALKNGRHIERVHYDHSTGKFTNPINIDPSKFVLFVGLHTFYIKRLRDVFDMKIFIEPDDSLRKHWKIIRDMKERAYTKERVLEQMEKREGDSQKFIKPQRSKADIILTYAPVKPIANIGDENEQVDIKLEIYCDNSLNIDPLMQTLSNVNTLTVNSWHEDDLENQCFECTGTISEEELNICAYALIPNLKEVVQNNSIEWEKDYHGMTQLFILYYLSENLKFKKHSNE